MGSSNRLIVSILVVAAVAVAFWVLALSPKREEADKLATEVEQQQVALAEAQSKAAEAAAAKRQFPADYRRLVVLGKAVPDGEEILELRWFDRDELTAALGRVGLPGATSIARWMLERWYGGPLSSSVPWSTS